MALLFKVIFAAHASGAHHKIALDALRQLRGENADRRADILLAHHKAYLRGSKAPDDTFKDFTRHVLHVGGDKEWGGALKAAEVWYGRLVSSLRQEAWLDAAYSAGVLTHYVADPHQPFHTGQSDAEAALHRALEWSVTRSYGDLQDILVSDLGGYPEIAVAERPNWLAELIRAGARAAHADYDVLIRHYDIASGKKDPKAGLDQELKDRMAVHLGRAVVACARVIERAFDEAAVTPPAQDLTMAGVLAGIETPMRWVLARIEDAGERAAVQAAAAELAQTGKVLRRLGPDERVVREAHARDVLGKSLAQLDAEPLDPIGVDHGDGAKRRVTRRAARMAKVTAWRPSDAPERPISETRPAAAPRGVRLSQASSVVDAPSIGPKTATRLHEIGIWTVADLLACDPPLTAAKLDARWITPALIQDWRDQARLVCDVPGLAGHDAQILVACGVRDRAALSTARIAVLTEKADAFAATGEGRRILRSSKAPDRDEVEGWITAARAAAAQGQAAGRAA